MKGDGRFYFACVLMLLEPDYGATAILLAVALIVFFMAGARLLRRY